MFVLVIVVKQQLIRFQTGASQVFAPSSRRVFDILGPVLFANFTHLRPFDSAAAFDLVRRQLVALAAKCRLGTMISAVLCRTCLREERIEAIERVPLV